MDTHLSRAPAQVHVSILAAGFQRRTFTARVFPSMSKEQASGYRTSARAKQANKQTVPLLQIMDLSQDSHTTTRWNSAEPASASSYGGSVVLLVVLSALGAWLLKKLHTAWFFAPEPDVLLRHAKKAKIEKLSEQQIEAARHRRRRDGANQKVALEDIDLPSNHPWATNNSVSQEEEEIAQVRLKTRLPQRSRRRVVGSNFVL